MIKVKIEDGALVCPGCGNTNLHQTSVKVYFRDEDGDEDVGTYVHVEDEDSVEMRRGKLPGGNPSPRRSGFSLGFWCEHCGEDEDLSFVLHVFQHKGQTFLSWEDNTVPD